jgi:hypothetical protein
MVEIVVAVLGMQDMEDVAADQFRARTAGDRAGGFVDADAAAAGVDFRDADSRVLVGGGETPALPCSIAARPPRRPGCGPVRLCARGGRCRRSN